MATVLTVGLAGLLAGGFVPTARELFRLCLSLLPPHNLTGFVVETGERAFFPVLAGLFLISLPRSRPRPPRRLIASWLSLSEISVLPILVGFAYGYFQEASSFLLLFGTPSGLLDVMWYLIFVPIGEELLFRGWFYHILDRLWPLNATATNPLPLALWMSSLAFALWHLQNLTLDPLPLVVFQTLYTFLTGMWLGTLRWRSGRLLPCVAAHILLNAAANLV